MVHQSVHFNIVAHKNYLPPQKAHSTTHKSSKFSREFKNALILLKSHLAISITFVGRDPVCLIHVLDNLPSQARAALASGTILLQNLTPDEGDFAIVQEISHYSPVLMEETPCLALYLRTAPGVVSACSLMYTLATVWDATDVSQHLPPFNLSYLVLMDPH
ncbi:hypothetical protein DSO57_1023989 [Entomophthora muscae]|uniref:Uncharacterized protein n=1 Tax=Entomophthora muscae TaxID=34485 RepID=A0ACC2TQL9_9FUNG|nr:hypothetical protein DSO57_1023989 [Entomophthora muscae]